LNNLLNNAIKFTTLGSVNMGYELDGDYIKFFVADTGVGISGLHIPKIFDRFYQADLSISRGYEGTGLGLAICKEIVNVLGGTIWVESELGKGSTFYFTILRKNDLN